MDGMTRTTPWANVTCDTVNHACKYENMWRVRVFCSQNLSCGEKRLVHSLIPVEGSHVVEEDAALINKWHVVEVNVWVCLFHVLWEDGCDNNQTKLLHRRLRKWHDASCPSSFENLVLLDLLEFSDRQVVQAKVEASQPHCKTFLVILNLFTFPIRWSIKPRKRIFLSFARSCFGYHFFIFIVLGLIPELLGVMADFFGFMFSSSSSRLILRGKMRGHLNNCLLSRHGVVSLLPWSQNWRREAQHWAKCSWEPDTDTIFSSKSTSLAKEFECTNL